MKMNEIVFFICGILKMQYFYITEEGVSLSQYEPITGGNIDESILLIFKDRNPFIEWVKLTS